MRGTLNPTVAPITDTSRPDVSIIVPALNEEATIGEVVTRLLALPLNAQIVVVDDGSTDKTPWILASFGDRITTIRHDKPQGKGASIVDALALCEGDVTICQDADLEYAPEQIIPLVEPILKGEAGVVFGSRFTTGMPAGMALPNKVVNKLLAWTVGGLFFRRVTDEATCYKAVRTDLMRRMDLQCKRFEFCPEVTAKAIRLGERIHERPIVYVPRGKDEGKKIRWTDAPEAFWTLARYRFWRPAPAGAEDRSRSRTVADNS
ncbi:glycosyltransferase family 2 protein [bacterium]|nr:MAG: glycosyltransferase family 2 protein [bacterium]